MVIRGEIALGAIFVVTNGFQLPHMHPHVVLKGAFASASIAADLTLVGCNIKLTAFQIGKSANIIEDVCSVSHGWDPTHGVEKVPSNRSVDLI